MAKFFGKIGFVATAEARPGVWMPHVTEREYYGDVTRNVRRLENTSQVNDDINIANTISIIADPFANENFHSMAYIELMGAKWKISSVEVQYPRLLLTIGGLYHGET